MDGLIVTVLISLAFVFFLLIWSFPFFHWVNNWGASEAEEKQSFPGEEVLRNSKVRCTHAIDIKAATNQVWPLLVPGLQSLKIGDRVKLNPQSSFLVIKHLEKNKSLALDGWFFYLIPTSLETTRLLVRGYDLGEKAIFSLSHFIAERRIIMGIKKLSEEHAGLERIVA